MSLHNDLLTAAAYLEGDGVSMEAAEADRIAGVFRSYATALCQQGEPIAQLVIQMDTHDMGQSLAPNPPFKSHRIMVTDWTAAEALPLGRYALYTHPAQADPSKAARDVLAERARQISAEGWTPEHDDEHASGEMALAAACYAAHTATWSYIAHGLDSKGGLYNVYRTAQEFVGRMWPWAKEWWKPKDERANLVRAAALLLAEIERLDRRALSTSEGKTE